jgi:hypothetical protein
MTFPPLLAPGLALVLFYWVWVATARRSVALREAITARSCGAHLLAIGEATIAGRPFLGCILWTGFELPIQTEMGLLVDTERAMRATKVDLNDYTSIRLPQAQECFDAPVSSSKPRKRCLAPDGTRLLHLSDRAWLAQKLDELQWSGVVLMVATSHATPQNALAPCYQSDWLFTSFLSELRGSLFVIVRRWPLLTHSLAGV